jgi:hypothetical protein
VKVLSALVLQATSAEGPTVGSGVAASPKPGSFLDDAQLARVMEQMAQAETRIAANIAFGQTLLKQAISTIEQRTAAMRHKALPKLRFPFWGI